MNDGLGMQDPDGIISYASQRFADMVGYTRSELRTMNVADLFDSENLQLLRENMAERREGHAERLEATLVRKDGSDLHVLISPQPIFDGQGQYQGSFAVMSDISARKHAEEALRNLNEELEQRIEQRTAALQKAQNELVRKARLATLGQLTATVGHELRNLLGTMRTSLYVLTSMS